MKRFGFSRLIRQGLVALALLSVSTASGGAFDPTSDVPTKLAVPSGHHICQKADAVGVQIYAAVNDEQGRAKWILEAPLATLTTEDKHVIYHYAGPTWEAHDGSAVVKDASVPVVSVAAKDDGDIPLLLLKVKNKSDGFLSKVDYIQRLNTHGGTPPATPPAQVGTKVGSPYTATYVFFQPE